MILVTGGTGFIGQALIQHLVGIGYPVRVLLRPSRKTPNLPKNIQVEAVICSFSDQRGLRAAMRDVEVVFHLAGAERDSFPTGLSQVDIEGTKSIVEAGVAARIKRLFYLSHIGSDRASGFPLLKAKAIAENFIVRSGLPHTIFRSSLVYGPGDQFTSHLARWIKASPGMILIPDQGSTLIQPIWLQDLIQCISLSIEDDQMINQIISIGGGDYISFKNVVSTLLGIMKSRRFVVSVPSSYLRILSTWFPNFPDSLCLSSYWLDYLAADRTTDLSTLPRVFGLIPTHFNQRIDYLYL